VNISPSSDHKNMCNSSLDSPRRCALNGGIFMSLASIDADIFWFLYFTRFLRYLAI